MPKADSVHSTPCTDTSVVSIGAPGAVQLSPASLILESRPGASLALASECESPRSMTFFASCICHAVNRKTSQRVSRKHPKVSLPLPCRGLGA
jgi:hypothetical protein